MGWRDRRRSALGTDGFGEVLAAARAGDAWAFEHLFALFARQLSGFLRARGAADWEGLANEVLLRAFRGIDRFEGDEAQCRAWIFTIARNALTDERRYHASRPATDPVPPSELPERPSSADAIEDALDDPLVRELLDDLSDDQREVLLLRVVADLGIEEVAQVVGKTPGAVKALQHRAVNRLRKRLSEGP